MSLEKYDIPGFKGVLVAFGLLIFLASIVGFNALVIASVVVGPILILFDLMKRLFEWITEPDDFLESS